MPQIAIEQDQMARIFRMTLWSLHEGFPIPGDLVLGAHDDEYSLGRFFWGAAICPGINIRVLLGRDSRAGYFALWLA